MRIARLLALLVLALAGAPLAAPAPEPRAPLPPGFQEVPVVAGLDAPTAIAFAPAPDDRLFIGEQSGSLRVFKAGALLPDPFVAIDVTANSERGLLGIAFDPNFAQNGFIYVYYTTSAGSLNAPPSPKNRVSRFTADGDVAAPGSEMILLDNIPSDAGNHNAGCLRFASDGTLYVATGDGGQDASNSQNLGNLAGKILRITANGGIPDDNPFVDTPGARGEIFCYGLRNPFRIAFRPANDSLYIADVGQNTWEEVNVGRPGGNFGWPQREGPSRGRRLISPIYAYRHTSKGASITGGCFITSANYPKAYRGNYFFGDYVNGFIRRMTVNMNDRKKTVRAFGPADSPVDFAQGPDGDLYYVSINNGSVRRIDYTGP